jgi:hypothetical protein
VIALGCGSISARVGPITRRIAVLLGLVLAALAAAPAALGAPLIPDIRTAALPTDVPQDVAIVDPSGEPRQLVFDNAWRNYGAGPWETTPAGDPAADDCDSDGDFENDVRIEQRVYEDDGDGIFERGTDAAFTDHDAGCMFFHPNHNHFHVGDVGLYSLLEEPTGAPVGASLKISFCLIDVDPFNTGMPGAPATSFYNPAQVCNDPDGVQGVSIGWFDEYSRFTQGQAIDLTDVEAGNYCLRSHADPEQRFVELDETNNLAERRYFLDPADEQVTPLSGPCRVSGEADTGPPETEITRGPRGTTHDRTPKFRFLADEEATFECRLDRRRWRSCSPPKRYGPLDLGRHRFKVKATDLTGLVEPKAAKRRFEILAR